MKRKIKLLKIVSNLFLIIGLILICIPLYLSLITAFKSTPESTENFFALPSSLYLENFKIILSKNDFMSFFFNSSFILIMSVVLILVFVPLTSYIIAKNMHRLYYKALYICLIAGILVPFQVIMLSVTQLMSSINLMNRVGLIILYATYALAQGAFLYVGYIKTVIPKELEEAAYIDGCGELKAYIKIIFPMLKPMTGTVIILNALWIWNDFLLPLLILNRSKSYWTLPLFQYNFKSQYGFQYNLAFAAFFLSVSVMVIIYAFFQKYIIAGLTGGAVKG